MCDKPLLQRKLELYRKLNNLSSSERSKFIKKLNTKQIQTISEIFKNILTKKFKCDKLIQSRLLKFRKEISRLGNKTTGNKKKILSSIRGGYLLNLVLPFAVSFLSKLFT